MAADASETRAELVSDRGSEEGSVPHPQRPEPPGERAAERSVRTTYKAIAALLAVASSATALLFTLVPDLRPTGTAPVQAAELSDLRVDADATYGQYLARIDQPRAGYSDRQLRRRGALLDFRVRIEGFKGKPLLLKWELFDETGTQVDESRAIEIRPTNPRNEARWQFFVPVPQDEGRYVAIVELLEEKDHFQLKLDSLESDALSAPRA